MCRWIVSRFLMSAYGGSPVVPAPVHKELFLHTLKMITHSHSNIAYFCDGRKVALPIHSPVLLTWLTVSSEKYIVLQLSVLIFRFVL